ncbi:glycosyltransferase family 2 protein [Demequina lutea]|uniref:N-acetylglucosaminyl-diphospho-decaprenol L-rhamnosyltransferase n=1 Tax=Demequina lutea TaxID=431489 RepID=A0A7Z0CGS1_9MICO|nr:glycosyltransferase family 2 protein [Demequina lutea]NYI40019.1 N-acetylglucosaminyl-diphospho-decaprenol L-rhamnosyltransferase [Demequina lutea]
MSNPAADVVVVTYFPGDTITSFLQSVVGADAVASVTIVDNATGDEAAERAAAEAEVAFVRAARNGGYGAGANLGAAHGSADWILISNADIVVGPGAIASLVAVGESDPSIGAVGPRVCEIDGTTYPSARPLPTLVLGAGHALFGKVWPSNPWSKRYRIVLDPHGGEVEAGWLSGSCLLVRRAAWDAVGGFDEGYFMFFEDVELGRGLDRAGYRRVWTPAASVTHLGGHSYRSDPAPMLEAHHASARRYVHRVYPRWWQAPVRAAVAAGLEMRQRAEVAAARKRLATRAD